MNLLKKWYNTISNLFNKKNQHGFKKYCLSGKCNICQTPWPKIEKTITEKYLDSIEYYSKYTIIWENSKYYKGYLAFPKGLSGREILSIAEKLKPEYTKLIKGDLEEESKKIAKLQGFNEEE